MKIIFIILALVMIFCTKKNNNEDSELLTKMLSESINFTLQEYYNHFDYNIDNTTITFGEKSIEFVPIIENIVQKDNQWVCGIRYEVLLNNSKREEFTFGSVGLDASKEVAIITSISEWISYAGLPILDYFFNNINSKNYLEFDNYKVFCGATGIRGEEPGSWLDGTKNMHNKLLGPIYNSINLQSQKLYTVSLLILNKPNIKIDGECKVNSRTSEEAFNNISLLNWPSRSNYIFKQFYILLPNQSNRN